MFGKSEKKSPDFFYILSVFARPPPCSVCVGRSGQNCYRRVDGMLFPQTSRFKKKFSTWNSVSGNLEWKKKEEGEEENKKKQEARDMRSHYPPWLCTKTAIKNKSKQHGL